MTRPLNFFFNSPQCKRFIYCRLNVIVIHQFVIHMLNEHMSKQYISQITTFQTLMKFQPLLYLQEVPIRICCVWATILLCSSTQYNLCRFACDMSTYLVYQRQTSFRWYPSLTLACGVNFWRGSPSLTGSLAYILRSVCLEVILMWNTLSIKKYPHTIV